jgi:hypothetical protein
MPEATRDFEIRQLQSVERTINSRCFSGKNLAKTFPSVYAFATRGRAGIGSKIIMYMFKNDSNKRCELDSTRQANIRITFSKLVGEIVNHRFVSTRKTYSRYYNNFLHTQFFNKQKNYNQNMYND